MSRRVRVGGTYAATGRVDRRAVGIDRAVIAETKASGSWSSAARRANGDECGSVDFALGRTLERFAGALSAIPNLPSTFPALGAHRRTASSIEDAGRASATTGWIGFIRVLHRRKLHRCKKGGSGVGPTKRGKGTKLMAIADRAGLPVAIHTAPASPHEVTLVKDTLEERFTEDAPQRLIGDRAYDSDKLDADLADEGIELISPHRSNRSKPHTQDRRALRRYRRRWKIERLFAWLQNFRRLVVRYEYHVANFLGFIQLGCVLILLRRYF